MYGARLNALAGMGVAQRLAVGLDSMVTAARYYHTAAVVALRRDYAPKDYFYSAALVPGN